MNQFDYTMSQDLSLESAEPGGKVDAFGYLKRSPMLPLLFVVPLVLCGVSWGSGGIPFATDLGFVFFTVLMFILLGAEFYRFPRRFGVGGIVLFGGALVWFCHDYMMNWFGRDFVSGASPISGETISKAAFFHCLFIACAAVGLRLPLGERLVRRIGRLPEPHVRSFYLILVVACFLIGMIPYFFFTAEGGFDALYGMITGGRTRSVRWLAGRTGSVNTSWGGYLALLIQIGQLGAQLGAFCAILVFRNVVAKGICWSIWLLYAALAFGSGTRGELAFMVLPVLALLFIKYQAQAVDRMKGHSVWAYVLCAMILFILLFFTQLQTMFRDRGFHTIDITGVSSSPIRGNAMFSEGLVGWSLIPDHQDYFYNKFLGQAVIAPIPVTVWYFALGPIPRALWPDKPLDPLQPWYNAAFTGRTVESYEGVSITPGLVTDWYCRYGPSGVIQGGILFGLICRLAEEAFRRSGGRPLQLIFAIGLAVFAFRAFRSFSFITLYPLLIGMLAIVVLVKLLNISGRRDASDGRPAYE